MQDHSGVGSFVICMKDKGFLSRGHCFTEAYKATTSDKLKLIGLFPTGIDSPVRRKTLSRSALFSSTVMIHVTSEFFLREQAYLLMTDIIKVFLQP